MTSRRWMHKFTASKHDSRMLVRSGFDMHRLKGQAAELTPVGSSAPIAADPSGADVLEAVFNSLPEAILVFGADRRVRKANRAARGLCGLDPVGKQRFEVLRHLQARRPDGSALAPDDALATEMGERGDQSLSVMIRGGQVLEMRSRSILLPGSLGGEAQMLILGAIREPLPAKQAEDRDLHGRGCVEGSTKVDSGKSQGADRACHQERLSLLGQLTGTLSHELRNPLAVIRSSAFYIQRRIGQTDAKVVKHLERIEQQVDLCDVMVADLLEVTRGRKPVPVPTEVNAWLSAVIEKVSLPNDVRLTTVFGPDLPAVRLDPEKMERVVTKLIENALQATVAARDDQREEQRNYVRELWIETGRIDEQVSIEVRDNGVGMSGDTLLRAFEPLFTTRARGFGLGLALAQKIVEEHGGTVHLSGELGKGTVATVRLPTVTSIPLTDSPGV